MATEETSVPRHGRHTSAARHSAPAPEIESAAVEAVPEEPVVPAQAPESVAQEAFAQVTPITDGDQETHMGDAPRPIDVDPSETGSFRRISAEEGARLTTRANASETASFRAQKVRPVEAVRMSTAGRPKVEHHEVEVKSNKRVFIILGIAALIGVAIGGMLLGRALSSVENIKENPVSEQVQATGAEGIEYRGAIYALTQQPDGKQTLTVTSEGSSTPAVLCELPGQPVTLILYNTVFIIPENLPDGTWNIIAHPLGDGGVTQPVTDAEGNPIIGQGEIAQATLAGDAVQVVTATGEQVTISLV